VSLPDHSRGWPGDVTVRLRRLFQPGRVQAGTGKNLGKSLNKLNAANETAIQKYGERGRSPLLFLGKGGSLN